MYAYFPSYLFTLPRSHFPVRSSDVHTTPIGVLGWGRKLSWDEGFLDSARSALPTPPPWVDRTNEHPQNLPRHSFHDECVSGWLRWTRLFSHRATKCSTLDRMHSSWTTRAVKVLARHTVWSRRSIRPIWAADPVYLMYEYAACLSPHVMQVSRARDLGNLH